MPFLGESHQHSLQHIRELLVELRKVINAQTNDIMATRFEQRSLTEEPPDSLDVRSPQLSTWHTRPPDESRQRRTLPSGSSNSLVQPPQPKVASSDRTWRPPPSRTTGEFVPLFGLQAPLFNGDDPVGWIFGIQEYFNHYLTTEDVRLAVIDKLIEYPATDWFHHYQQNNIEGSWMDFLVAVRHHFAPELIEEITHTADEMQPLNPPSGTFLDLISHEIDASVPVVNSERRDSSMEAVVAAPAISNEHRPESIIDAQAIATDSSILDAATDSVLDVATDSVVGALPRSIIDDDNVVDVRVVVETKVGGFMDDEMQLAGSMLCDGNPDEALDIIDEAFALHCFGPELLQEVSQNVALELVADKIPSDVDGPDGGVVLSAAAQLVTDPFFVAVPCDVVAWSYNVRLSPVLRDDTIYEVRKLYEFSNHEVDGDDALLAIESAQKDPQYVAAPTPSDSDYMESCLKQQTFPGVGDHDLFKFEQKLSSDGRLIPPRNAATGLDGSFNTSWRPLGSQMVGKVSAIAALPQNNFIASRSLEDIPMEVSYLGDGKGSSATIQFGEDKGVHVFDPGAFDVRVRSMSSVAIFLVLDQSKWNVAYCEPGSRLDSCVDDMLMSSNGVVVAWPFSIIKWFMHFYSANKNWEKTGVVVLVPNDWWHLVTHLEGYVTITKYFASLENWLHVFDLLIRLNPSRSIYGTSDGILWHVHLTSVINLALHGTIDELKMDANERESANPLFLDPLTNYKAAPEVHKLMELAMSCDYMQVKEGKEESSSRSFAELGADYGMLELNGPVAPHVVDVLHSYFEFHLEGKVVFNGGSCMLQSSNEPNSARHYSRATDQAFCAPKLHYHNRDFHIFAYLIFYLYLFPYLLYFYLIILLD